jgi:adenine/guanine phosphoribosyltransferase-like PRPP-binding protein
MYLNILTLNSYGLKGSGQNLIHRVDTSLTLQRYSIWLQRMIAHNFIRFPNIKPKHILTVDEYGQEFAAIVSRAAGVKVTIITLTKDTNRHIQVGSAESELRLLKGKHILIVDDGINTGKTINELIDVCNGFGIIPQGILVFDNRLDNTEIRSIERKLPNYSKVLALYSWPTGHLVA